MEEDEEEEETEEVAYPANPHLPAAREENYPRLTWIMRYTRVGEGEWLVLAPDTLVTGRPNPNHSVRVSRCLPAAPPTSVITEADPGAAKG